MQVRLGQARQICDQLHGGAAKACLGKNFFRRLQNKRFIVLADLVSAQGADIIGHGG